MSEGDKNTHHYPLSDALYDVIAVLHKKSKALEVYDKILLDVQADTNLRQLFIQIRRDDHQHVEDLKAHVARLLVSNDNRKAS